MVNAKKKIDEQWAGPPKAKRHPVLDDIKNELTGCHVHDIFEVSGRKYELRTLTPLEESWADGFVDGQNFYQTGRNRRAPYVAAALVSIDGVAMTELFVFPTDEASEGMNELMKDKAFADGWRRREALDWLTQSSQPSVLDELWACYLELSERRNKALETVGPLSKRTPTGESSPTSLPVKAS